jgi:hypothetical protein
MIVLALLTILVVVLASSRSTDHRPDGHGGRDDHARQMP